MTEPIVVRVEQSSQVAAARRAAADLAWRLHFDETTAGRLALVVTELATNLVKHGGGGEVVLRRVDLAPAGAVEVVALDRGPGMANVARCLQDGYSTAGSPGTGLGAVQRLSTGFDVWSRPKNGARRPSLSTPIWSERPSAPDAKRADATRPPGTPQNGE